MFCLEPKKGKTGFKSERKTCGKTRTNQKKKQNCVSIFSVGIRNKNKYKIRSDFGFLRLLISNRNSYRLHEGEH